MFCGKQDSRDDGAIVNTLDGPVAVLRNLQAIWPNVDKNKRRCVVIDRFYTSVALFIRLDRMGYHCIGTCRTDRIGFPDSIKMKCKEPPAGMSRGTSVIMENIKVDFITIVLLFCLLFSLTKVCDLRCQSCMQLDGQTTSSFTSYHLVRLQCRQHV